MYMCVHTWQVFTLDIFPIELGIKKPVWKNILEKKLVQNIRIS